MTSSELNKVLLELYALEPELKEYETILKNLILRMSDLKPDTKFDSVFAAQLKQKIIQEANQVKINQPQKKQVINLNFMNKKIYWATGSLAVTAIMVLVVTSLINPNGEQYSWPTEIISQLPAGAFGDLASLNNSNQETTSNGSNITSPMGLGGDSLESGALAARSISSASDTSVTTISSDLAEGKMMIMPYYNYNYEYAGEALDLTESEGSVYRRIKGDGQSGRALANLIKDLNFPDIDLSSFTNLRATNLSLVEDKDMGLMVMLDFNEDNIYISENWEKWRIMERENCAGDQACWDKWRLKIEDVPTDSDLITKANSFLSQHRINLEHYGEPIVDNNWREMYIQTANKNDFYVPEYSSVVYPLLINGDPVRDQSGAYSGLRVTINLIRNAASGLSGLSPYRYESSSYQLETDPKNILAAAEKGGWNRGWFGGSENSRTLKLGTPEKSLVQMWRYADGKSSELMVPALIFPVLGQPSDNGYYGPKFVTVPLVKEMLSELSNEQSNWPSPASWRGGLEPIITTDDATVTNDNPTTDSLEITPFLQTDTR